MTHSIKKIFENINIYLFFILFLSMITTLLVLEKGLSIKKIDNLMYQKVILKNLNNLQVDDIGLALIQFNSNTAQLLNDTQKLFNFYQYNFTQKYVLNNENEYNKDLIQLKNLTKLFNDNASNYYISYEVENNNIEKKTDLNNSLEILNRHIDSIIFKEIIYNKEIFLFIEKLVYFTLLITLVLTFIYRKQLKHIYVDILFLYSVKQGRNTHQFYSKEMDAISLRMKRKTTASDDPSMLDKVTGINNYKGMHNAYAQKKDLNKENITAITIFEIDNFSKSNKAYSEESIQTILKKVAFTISLSEQPIDVIARSDYNQFTLIISRVTKEQAFKDIEIIHNSLSELKFNLSEKDTINITLSGGFMVKPKQMHIDESIRIAKLTVKYARDNGGDRISKDKEILSINI